ncbi:collagen alpha-1(I) chain-like [Lethenteron reissneri]|uniref:collagen alpha-1(I) chain-like n=1 Tax=Lethenteron reissneri TaxID=7753 RepID=UPI002AB66397|nr:collagen alpha-1(I) chain-like [Lethenteron reissneri]
MLLLLQGALFLLLWAGSAFAGLYEACGGRIDVGRDPQGTVRYGPQWGQYPHNAHCVWHLDSWPSERTFVRLSYIDVEFSPSCQYDSLSVTLGGDRPGEPESTQAFCWRESQVDVSSLSALSGLGAARLTFTSDASVSFGGFSINYFVALDWCGRFTPCQNGGTCHNTDTRFRCECPPGWEGEVCDQAVAALPTPPSQLEQESPDSAGDNEPASPGGPASDSQAEGHGTGPPAAAPTDSRRDDDPDDDPNDDPDDDLTYENVYDPSFEFDPSQAAADQYLFSLVPPTVPNLPLPPAGDAAPSGDNPGGAAAARGDGGGAERGDGGPGTPGAGLASESRGPDGGGGTAPGPEAAPRPEGGSPGGDEKTSAGWDTETAAGASRTPTADEGRRDGLTSPPQQLEPSLPPAPSRPDGPPGQTALPPAPWSRTPALPAAADATVPPVAEPPPPPPATPVAAATEPLATRGGATGVEATVLESSSTQGGALAGNVEATVPAATTETFCRSSKRWSAGQETAKAGRTIQGRSGIPWRCGPAGRTYNK